MVSSTSFDLPDQKQEKQFILELDQYQKNNTLIKLTARMLYSISHDVVVVF